MKLALVLGAVLDWYGWATVLIGRFAGTCSARCTTRA
ncbi:hypothetical protein [Streptomyces sp. NPDC007905]